MDETRIRTLEDVDQFLAGTAGTTLELQGNKDDVYRWAERTLVRCYIERVTQRTVKGFETKSPLHADRGGSESSAAFVNSASPRSAASNRGITP